ncbi:MAG: histidine kinase dimerization/phospho-acceptor domain-containing protein [Chloroflexota bacterium]
MPARDSQGRIVKWYGTATDIDALKQAEEEREDLIRTVSHDLRTPLTAIMGQAQIIEKLLDRSGQDGDLRRSANAIITGGRRMNT